jgi:hypothetical protein
MTSDKIQSLALFRLAGRDAGLSPQRLGQLSIVSYLVGNPLMAVLLARTGRSKRPSGAQSGGLPPAASEDPKAAHEAALAAARAAQASAEAAAGSNRNAEAAAKVASGAETKAKAAADAAKAAADEARAAAKAALGGTKNA